MPQTPVSTTAPPDGDRAATAFSTLLSPITLGRLTLRNRLCMTGHGTGMPTDGTPNDRMIAYYEERARGEVGLIMLGSQQVHPSSPGITGLLCNYDARIIPGLARLARRVQAHGTRIFGYLSHMGFASSARPGPLWSASPGYEEKYGEAAHAMTGAEIIELVEAHADAAARCIEAGLDGIEIHCGHGLLVQQFLSPLTNKRSDGYGGSVENRLRFATEILAAVRDRIGAKVPLGIRCSGDELVPGGLTGADMARIVPHLVAAGRLDYVDVSAGSDGNLVSNMLHEPPMGLPPGPFRPLARRIREAVDVPVIHGTRIPTAGFAEEMLAAGDADMAGMARGLIADPHLARKARTGRMAEIVPCIGCEQACFGRLFRGRHISCVGNPATGRERPFHQADTARHVVVVGGGPAGMEAARLAALRGHRVTLLERGDQLGGRLNLAALPPGRAEWRRLVTHKAAELTRLGVRIIYGKAADATRIAGLAPDAVTLATGARPRPFALPGDDSIPVLSLDAAVAGWARGAGPTGRILVVDQLHRAPAIAAAIGFAQAGHTVTLCATTPHVGQHLEIQNLTHFYREALSARVNLLPMVKPVRIEGGQVTFENIFTRDTALSIAFDSLVAAIPGLPDTALADALAPMGIPVMVIGDAYAPRDAEAALLDGFKTGAAL
ncbi:FAD-dependent oxidoreductase [Rhodophyticola sp. CCM32]|uniref:oxidoreductase n=1 Tax=Rhodophyticola sp. CCM32 TaxID=2916397 RepID=UPI00107FA31E|nr:FAD-dependent oxidoreductase [Rhodophyticola sp. CCM32]QBY00085.1 FAD-dependent oxidoreductase [Rhodophyticola sp. CCM32]